MGNRGPSRWAYLFGCSSSLLPGAEALKEDTISSLRTMLEEQALPRLSTGGRLGAAIQQSMGWNDSVRKERALRTSSMGARAWMTVGGGGGGGGDGISAINELVTSLRLGATAVTKLLTTACAGAGTGSLPARRQRQAASVIRCVDSATLLLTLWPAGVQNVTHCLCWHRRRLVACTMLT